MYISEVVRIGSVIIFPLGKLRKAKFFIVLCDVIVTGLSGELWLSERCPVTVRDLLY